jgi:biopolymer transport protein ExbD
MAASSTESESGFSSINMTPLVDIMLVLLIIFMVTAKLIVSQTLPMDLPKAASGEQQQTVFSVAIAKDGQLSVNGRSVAGKNAVVELASAAHHRTPDVRAVIQADERVSHGTVVRVMDQLKRAGIAKIAFGVTPDVAD